MRVAVSTSYFLFFNFRYSDRWVVKAHCGFNLPFSDDSGAEYLSVCLFVIHISTLMTHLFKSFDFLFNQIIFLLFSCENNLYIPARSPLTDT